MLTPSASSKSAEPDLDEAARLPCLTTLAPAAAATMAAEVEIFIVLKPSPPVPTVSTARSVISMGALCLYITLTKAFTSSAVSPLAFRAKRKSLICAISALPCKISFIAHWAEIELRSNPLVSVSVSWGQVLKLDIRRCEILFAQQSRSGLRQGKWINWVGHHRFRARPGRQPSIFFAPGD